MKNEECGMRKHLVRLRRTAAGLATSAFRIPRSEMSYGHT